MLSPGSNKVQQMLPAVADFGELLLDVSGFARVAGSGKALSEPMQMLLVLLCHRYLLLVVLRFNLKTMSKFDTATKLHL